MTGDAADSVEKLLRDELARGDAVIAGARPVLRYLLAHDGHPLFSEATVARVRGMMFDLASQLLHAEAAEGEVRDRGRYVAERREELAASLIEDGAFLAHAQALVLEAELAERLQSRDGIDAVLPPLVQELVAEDGASTAALAVALLAAQARFMQHCRRMEMPLRELPGDLFHAGLTALRALGGPRADAAERRLRHDYHEGAGRLGLMARALTGMDELSGRALSIDHAGVSVFATALSIASRQDRDLVILSFAEGQFARLLLAMRAAGLDQRAMARQLLFLHPGHRLPDEFEEVRVEQAAAFLSARETQDTAD